MTEIWPLKVGLLNPKSIWRGVAPAKDGVKFDGHTAVAAVIMGPRMTVIWPSILIFGWMTSATPSAGVMSV